MNKEQARPRIQELVDRFRDTPVKQRNAYNEQETRLYFILPLFEALGWDTRNPAEMSAEEQISRGFVDFGFYLNGVPAFYLETKRVSEDLEDEQWAKQALNYSWLKGVTWAVLSDFEGIKVFNAEVQEKNPSRAVFLDLHWEQYAEDQFDDLWLLSKESYITGDINKLAERFGKKARKEPVSKQLFSQLTVWRRELFREIQGFSNLFAQDTQKLDEAVQRLLDRLIFLRTVEDRGIEEPHLKALLNQYQQSRKKDKNLFRDVLNLFREMDERYNARLFAAHQLDLLEMHNDLLLERIIKGLYDAPGGYNRYDFSVISADILGTIYEQYLSFKATDRAGKTAFEPGKQVKRKSQGIYYTPQFVVRYIVQQTLGKFLQEGADPYQIRVLDPACGSGSFLIEAFDVLDRHLAQHGTAEDQQYPRRRRLKILQNNLYGVDLDPQAVEVAQLNLLLRAAYEREKLPMLGHIQVGNSLIDDPAVAGKEFAFNWSERFPDVMAAGGFDVVIGNPPYVQSRNGRISESEKVYLEKVYKSSQYQINTYGLFIEKSINLLKKNQGQLGLIVPNYWVSTASDEELRKLLFLEHHTHELVNTYSVFTDAIVDTVLLFTKTTPQPTYPKSSLLRALDRSSSIDERLLSLLANRWSVESTYEIQDSTQKISIGFTKQLALNGEKTLGDYLTFKFGMKPYQVGKGQPSQTAEIVASKIFDAKKKVDENYLPLLGARHIKRFLIAWEGEWIKYGVHLAEPRTLDLFQGKRLLLQRIVSDEKLHITYTDTDFICNTDVITLKLKNGSENVPNLYFFLGLLASHPCALYLKSKNINLDRETFPKINTKSLESFPLPNVNLDDPADKARHDRMVSLVEKMLALKQEHAAAAAQMEDRRHPLAEQITRLDQQIDALVYELYDLTPEEIAIVEG